MADPQLLIFATGSLVLATPLILAAMGGLTCERSGIMNIALEGFMLTAACVSALVGAATESAILGLIAGIGSSVLLSLFHDLLTQTFTMDQIVSGMGINAIAFGGTNFLDKRFTDVDRAGVIPGFPTSAYVAIALMLPVILAVYVAHTRGGLRLWAVGNDPEKARQMGVRPGTVRFWALLWTGVFCGLAGTMLVADAGRFTDGMTAGRGFIALAALILGSWRPVQAALVCVVFGAFQALQLLLQGTRLFGAEIPSQVWNAVPYLVTVLALVGFLGRNRAPAGLGKI